MKKNGVLNAQLMGELTKLRHTDKVVICDAGFPIPRDAAMVDVSLVAGVPTMMQTLKAVLNEGIFEEYIIFDMMKDYNKEYHAEIKKLLHAQKSSEMTMPEFIESAKDAKLYIRTGELLPCSNIMLVSASGVPALCEPLDVVCK